MVPGRLGALGSGKPGAGQGPVRDHKRASVSRISLGQIEVTVDDLPYLKSSFWKKASLVPAAAGCRTQSPSKLPASDLISQIFGNAGSHTRAAVSTNSLPLGVSVEIDAIFELN